MRYNTTKCYFNIKIPKEKKKGFTSPFFLQFSSVQSLSHVRLSRPHEPQHARPPCPVGDAIQPSHPLLSASPPAFNLSQHQGLFQWVNSSHKVAKVLKLQLQHQCFQWIFRTNFLIELTGLISLLSKGLSGVFSSTAVQKHQFFGTQLSL